MICHRNASTVADHILSHKGSWLLFSDLLNLQGLCGVCHSRKTAAEDSGFGNAPFVGIRPDTNAAVTTGDRGKQFQSSTVDSKKVDAALVLDVDFLSGIPE